MLNKELLLMGGGIKNRVQTLNMTIGGSGYYGYHKGYFGSLSPSTVTTPDSMVREVIKITVDDSDVDFYFSNTEGLAKYTVHMTIPTLGYDGMLAYDNIAGFSLKWSSYPQWYKHQGETHAVNIEIIAL